MGQAAPADEWVVGDRYRFDAPIGAGGMGEVYRGYDLQLDRRVAIKLMQPPPGPAFRPGTAEAADLAEAAALDRERFLREIRTMAGLELPGIPAVYDFGTEESTDRIYLIMQLIYGQTLDDLIAARDYSAEPWPPSWAAAIAAQIAATLLDVHRVDVVHRDIKPSNLMVSVSGLVKILDFGVAILRGARALPKLTQVGMTVGSPPYMSPEQVLGNPAGPPADVYALGCVLHEMLTGRVPFAETANRSYRDHHVNTPPASLRPLRPDVPSGLDDLVLAMLAKRPADRPDAEAVYDALMPFVRSGPPTVAGDRDPRRPFLRPLAPIARRAETDQESPARTPKTPLVPLSVDEALELSEHVGRLVDGAQLQQAIDLLDNAVKRSAHLPALELEMKIELATALYLADEFSRAATVLDVILPEMADRDDAALLRYYAGVSHAETGDIDAAINYMSSFLASADPEDPLYREAMYQLGMMLPAVGRGEEGLRHLESLRPILVAAYGPDSVHVNTLDRRIAQIRRGIVGT
jgi:serine/threonine protein kinase